MTTITIRPTGTAPTDGDTLKAAIAGASDGDTILMKAYDVSGTYQEWNFGGKPPGVDIGDLLDTLSYPAANPDRCIYVTKNLTFTGEFCNIGDEDGDQGRTTLNGCNFFMGYDGYESLQHNICSGNSVVVNNLTMKNSCGVAMLGSGTKDFTAEHCKIKDVYPIWEPNLTGAFYQYCMIFGGFSIFTGFALFDAWDAGKPVTIMERTVSHAFDESDPTVRSYQDEFPLVAESRTIKHCILDIGFPEGRGWAYYTGPDPGAWGVTKPNVVFTYGDHINGNVSNNVFRNVTWRAINCPDAYVPYGYEGDPRVITIQNNVAYGSNDAESLPPPAEWQQDFVGRYVAWVYLNEPLRMVVRSNKFYATAPARFASFSEIGNAEISNNILNCDAIAPLPTTIEEINDTLLGQGLFSLGADSFQDEAWLWEALNICGIDHSGDIAELRAPLISRMGGGAVVSNNSIQGLRDFVAAVGTLYDSDGMFPVSVHNCQFSNNSTGMSSPSESFLVDYLLEGERTSGANDAVHDCEVRLQKGQNAIDNGTDNIVSGPKYRRLMGGASLPGALLLRAPARSDRSSVVAARIKKHLG